MFPKITFGGESAVTGEGVLLKVAWRRGPGAGVASAEVDSLAVYLHVVGMREALTTIRALVGTRHLVDGLNVPGEAALHTEGFAACRTFEVLNPGVYGPHVEHHIVVILVNLVANAAFVALFSGRLPVAVWETEAGLMIHEDLTIGKDPFTSLADQLPVVLGKLEAVG